MCSSDLHGCREVAEHGAALMTEELAKLQYHDLHNFARAALPRELALLVVEGVRVPPRAESDNPMFAVLQAVAAIERDTDELIYQLGEYQELINGLGSWAGGVRSVIDRANRMGSLMGESSKSLLKSVCFLFILHIFCNIFINAVCYLCINPVFHCFK